MKLSFDRAGHGEHTFLFIHGVGTNRSFFSPEFQYFSQKAEALNVDLRGHGKSDKPQDGYSMEEYAEDLGQLCQELKVKKLIIVAHSMGGNIALEFYSRYPDLVAAIALLDTNLFIPNDALTFLSGRIEALKKNFETALDEIIAIRCLPTDRCQKAVKEAFFATPQHVWYSSLEKMIDWDKKRAEECVRQCTVPVLYVEGPKLVMDVNRFESNYPSKLVRGKVVGSGHFLTLEVPEQICPMIDRFLSITIKK